MGNTSPSQFIKIISHNRQYCCEFSRQVERFYFIFVPCMNKNNKSSKWALKCRKENKKVFVEFGSTLGERNRVEFLENHTRDTLIFGKCHFGSVFALWFVARFSEQRSKSSNTKVRSIARFMIRKLSHRQFSPFHKVFSSFLECLIMNLFLSLENPFQSRKMKLPTEFH